MPMLRLRMQKPLVPTTLHLVASTDKYHWQNNIWRGPVHLLYDYGGHQLHTKKKKKTKV